MGERVAVLQMVSGTELEANLAAAARLIERAAGDGARLLVLPEAFALFLSSAQRDLGEREAGALARIRPFLAGQAARHGVWLVGGTIPLLEADDPRPRAACLVFDDAGREVARYDKVHLFDVEVGDRQGRYCESDTFRPGTPHAVTVATPVGVLGLAVCYDLRFAELFVRLRRQGAELIAIPSAFTRRTGLAHWLPLLRARAIETQCYLLGANQGGEHSSRRHTSGGSAIVDGWGEVRGEAGFGEAVVAAQIDLEKLREQRAAMPVMAHRRFDLSL
jgi:nitrilase